MVNNIDSLNEEMVYVNRVTKVVKGGRVFSFSVIVVLGNEAGVVGYALGKAKEVVNARLKASGRARKVLYNIPLYENRTIFHDVQGTCCASKVLLRKAESGTGIIAGGVMRSIFRCVGIKDIVAKSLGSSNPHTMIAATFIALRKLFTPEFIKEKRLKNFKG